MRTGSQDLSYGLHTNPPPTSLLPQLVREENLHHRATRPCPVCREAMTGGRCGEHGEPCEDYGWRPA